MNRSFWSVFLYILVYTYICERSMTLKTAKKQKASSFFGCLSLERDTMCRKRFSGVRGCVQVRRYNSTEFTITSDETSLFPARLTGSSREWSTYVLGEKGVKWARQTFYCLNKVVKYFGGCIPCQRSRTTYEFASLIQAFISSLCRDAIVVSNLLRIDQQETFSSAVSSNHLTFYTVFRNCVTALTSRSVSGTKIGRERYWLVHFRTGIQIHVVYVYIDKGEERWVAEQNCARFECAVRPCGQ